MSSSSSESLKGCSLKNVQSFAQNRFQGTLSVEVWMFDSGGSLWKWWHVVTWWVSEVVLFSILASVGNIQTFGLSNVWPVPWNQRWDRQIWNSSETPNEGIQPIPSIPFILWDVNSHEYGIFFAQNLMEKWQLVLAHNMCDKTWQILHKEFV